MTSPMLFHKCPLAGCANLVDRPARPCEACMALFDGPDGFRLVPAPADRARSDEEIAADIAAGDARVREVLAERRLALAGEHGSDAAAREKRIERKIAAKTPALDGDEKSMQQCWMCEERRTCTRIDGLWECRDCQGVTG